MAALPIPRSCFCASSNGNSKRFHFFFQFSGFLIFHSSHSLYIRSTSSSSSSPSFLTLLDPSTPTPREAKWDKYTYTLSCHVPQHPTLRTFLILPVFLWAPLSFRPQFHGCFKTRPTETWFLSVFIPIDCLEVQHNRVAESHRPSSSILGKAVFSQSQQSSWHYGGSAQPCGNKLIQTHLHLNKTESERERTGSVSETHLICLPSFANEPCLT